MSRMLSFYDAAWTTACDRAKSGRRAEALASLTPLLSGAADVPTRLVLLAHRLAARLSYAAGRHAAARRHLRAAEPLDPRSADIQYELGLAFEDDPYGCDRRAARRFRRAVALGPGQPKYAAALGRALVRINRCTAGVAYLKQAAAAAPVNAAVLAVVVDGLCDAGKFRTASRVVARARFQSPGDPAIRRLEEQARYALARAKQQASRAPRVGAAPVVLPFVRLGLVGRTVEAGGGVIRRDVVSLPGPHFARSRVNRTERG